MLRTREKLFCYGVAALFIAFLLAPILWMLSSSLKGPLDIFAKPPVLVGDVTLENYRQVLSDSTFMRSFLNSVLVSAGTVVASMLLALPAAYGLSRLRSVAKAGLLSWVLLVRAAPGMIFVIPYFVAFTQIGLMDTRIGLIVINTVFTAPLAIWILIAFFDAIPLEIEEAAVVDGATRWQTFLRVSLPMAAPGIVSAAILVFIFSWNEFLFALTLTQVEAKTAAVAILNYMAYQGTEWGKIAAAGIIILLPVALFAVAIRKYFIQTAAGGVKG
ncbi:multiple sugar transport system permease protein [Paracoccus pantotrophus]|nr:multiple sugar transport system permease protein [Paracoccus pantotrophus]